MTSYPSPLERRFSATLQQLQRDVTKLKTRTAGIDSGFPVMLLPGVISGTYTSGDPEVYVNGATTLSGPFQHLTSYTPAAGDSVLLAPVVALRTYVVLGKLSG